MKRIFVIFLTTLMLSAVYGQNTATIEFNKKVHDFGSITENGGTATCTFEFTNTGKAPLVINNVSASCGCTTPEWTKSPVAPGKKGSIKVAYNPAGRPGPFDKTVSVSSNATESMVVLRIRGTVEQKVLTTEEKYPVSIGSLRLKSDKIAMARINNASSRTETVEVYNNGSSPLIVSFENVPAHIKLEADPISIPAKQTGTIKCTYLAAMKKDFGPVIDMVTVKAGNSSGKIQVQATIEEDISKLTLADFDKAPVATVKNSSSDFGRIKKGQVVTGTFEITNTGKSDLIIRKLSPDCNCIKASASTTTIKPGGSSTIKAELDSKNEEGQKFYNITVVTNAPRQQMLTLFMPGSVIK